MKPKANLTLDQAVAQEKSPLSKIVLQWDVLTRDIVNSAKTRQNFGTRDWDPLAEIVDVKNFKRVGASMEIVPNWNDYCDLLSPWARKCSWDITVRRLTEQPGVVFQELIEFGTYVDSGHKHICHSLSVFEFNDQNKICHLDVYLQREDTPLPPGVWDV
jgi:hypothetical protein